MSGMAPSPSLHSRLHPYKNLLTALVVRVEEVLVVLLGAEASEGDEDKDGDEEEGDDEAGVINTEDLAGALSEDGGDGDIDSSDGGSDLGGHSGALGLHGHGGLGSAELEAAHGGGGEGGGASHEAEEEDGSMASSTLTTRSSSRKRKGGNDRGNKSQVAAAKNGRNGAAAAVSPALMKGKGRRSLFKKSAAKAPMALAKTVTSDRIFYKGQYYTRGDIVSVTDVDGGTYYGQFRGFLSDQYCEKSGVITWLLPTTLSPPPEEGFDPATYILGPEEELPRRLEFFTFVMHAPDDYFHYRNAPYPTKSQVGGDQEYLLTRAGPRVRVVKQGRPVYQDLVYE